MNVSDGTMLRALQRTHFSAAMAVLSLRDETASSLRSCGSRRSSGEMRDDDPQHAMSVEQYVRSFADDSDLFQLEEIDI